MVVQREAHTPSNERTHPTRIFQLERLEDVSGMSGTGIVAEGTQYHDGQCTLSWFGHFHSLEIHPSIEQLEYLHGHGGRTKVVWLTEAI